MKKAISLLLTLSMLMMPVMYQTAYAATQTYTVTLLPYSSENGTASVYPLTAKPGEMVNLSAAPYDNAVFYYWHVYSYSGYVDIYDIYSPDTSFEMPDGNVQVRPIFIRSSSPDSNQQNLPAVPNNHSSWAAPELRRAAALDIIPESLKAEWVDYTMPISRAEFAGIVVKTYEKLADTEVLPVEINPFIDTWDIDALRAYNAGLMVGISSNEFAPYSIPSREQAATALTRAFKKFNIPGWSFAEDAFYVLDFEYPELFSDDANISEWSRDSVYFMAANNIIQGVGNNMFAPRAMTSSEEVMGFAVTTREEAIILALRTIENLR